MSTAPAQPDGFQTVVLAGERRGGNALARRLNLPAGVLAPLAGQPCLAWVLNALRAADSVDRLLLAGPDTQALQASAALRELVSADDVEWLPPEAGPAASAGAALRHADRYPALLTSGDHGLLTGAIVDDFCRRAVQAADLDLAVGLVPRELVQSAYPHSRRTVLRFAGRAFCGSNLFALLTPGALSALTFWQTLEADRKQPWKLARHLGATTLARYLAGRLTVDDAFAVLSERAGCRIGWVPVPFARAAVDVDSEADWRLADALLRDERGEPLGSAPGSDHGRQPGS